MNLQENMNLNKHNELIDGGDVKKINIKQDNKVNITKGNIFCKDKPDIKTIYFIIFIVLIKL